LNLLATSSRQSKLNNPVNACLGGTDNHHLISGVQSTHAYQHDSGEHSTNEASCSQGFDLSSIIGQGKKQLKKSLRANISVKDQPFKDMPLNTA
jgi:hypothetical protein